MALLKLGNTPQHKAFIASFDSQAMRWTDEVHVERTLHARHSAKEQLLGREPKAKGNTAVVHFVAATGLWLQDNQLRALCFNEKRY